LKGEEYKMSLLKRRLNDLWQRQAATIEVPHLWPCQSTEQMLVTITEPMKISGTVLGPGRYAFRPLDPCAASSSVLILNEDETKLLATVSANFN
jgi:hypothetical protein